MRLLAREAQPAGSDAEESDESPLKPIKTRKTSRQQNADWQNENARGERVKKRYKKAYKEATILFNQKKEGDLSDPRAKMTQEQIVDHLNKKYRLDGGRGCPGLSLIQCI
eukprot:scaffold32561_cov32-Cyclotella_meneghiniana.AAC.8